MFFFGSYEKKWRRKIFLIPLLFDVFLPKYMNLYNPIDMYILKPYIFLLKGLLLHI